MRHLRRTRKLGWKTAHREAVFRNMVTSLLEHGRIITTVPRAKELRKIADKMITLAKNGTLHAKRQALSVIRDRNVVTKLFTHWKDIMEDRNGGYCRLVQIGPRVGDASPMTIVEMVVESFEKSGDKKKKTAQAITQTKKTEIDAKPEVIPVPETIQEFSTVMETQEQAHKNIAAQEETAEEKQEEQHVFTEDSTEEIIQSAGNETEIKAEVADTEETKSEVTEKKETTEK
jgi:large subunit ribosomal protein L17